MTADPESNRAGFEGLRPRKNLPDWMDVDTERLEADPEFSFEIDGREWTAADLSGGYAEIARRRDERDAEEGRPPVPRRSA